MELVSDLKRLRPRLAGARALRPAVAGERELTAMTPILVLEHDAADRAGIARIVDPVEDHLGDGDAAEFGLAARLEIDRVGKALHFLARVGAFGDGVVDPGVGRLDVGLEDDRAGLGDDGVERRVGGTLVVGRRVGECRRIGFGLWDQSRFDG